MFAAALARMVVGVFTGGCEQLEKARPVQAVVAPGRAVPRAREAAAFAALERLQRVPSAEVRSGAG